MQTGQIRPRKNVLKDIATLFKRDFQKQRNQLLVFDVGVEGNKAIKCFEDNILMLLNSFDEVIHALIEESVFHLIAVEGRGGSRLREGSWDGLEEI